MNIDEIIEMLIDANIYVYRLDDGTQIVAEEIDEVDDKMLLSFPAIIEGSYSEFTLNVWNVFQSVDVTEISSSHIVAKSECQLTLRCHYYNFCMANTMYAEDKADSLEEGQSILEEYLGDIDTLDKSGTSKYSNRWDWNPNLN